MAVDVCSEISSLVASPRISFSHDLNQTDIVPVERYHRRSDASLLDPNFDFCKIFAQELPYADELFFNGKILPIEVKKVTVSTKEIHQSEPILVRPDQPTTTAIANENTNDDSKKKRLKEYLSNSCDAEEDEKPLTKSFWQFRRSSSLNCDNGRSKGFIRSLQFLSRSNSTGSALNSKQTVLPKENLKQQSQKQPPPSSSPPPIASTKPPLWNSTAFNSYNSSRKSPLGKNSRSYGKGLRFSPVLNIPQTYISKGTASLFGLGSLFCND
ncbi:hypothetical protein F0562_034067 [Nyssa sinensis]|uniref:Uncharacterized protein n=1 Tax=Nyssa sinensis TaxID=561372 RepID=A0A5J5AFV0_9ASTE|nr:hypothetical protein F0562_034067 [Nyssa sinensis]